MKVKEKNKSPKVIFEDIDILIIDKPAGLVVNKSKTTKFQKTLQDWLKQNFNFELAKVDSLRSGIVHRIDKETSGLLVVSKNKKVFEEIQKQFKERKVVKTYLALVHGKVEPRQADIQAPVGRLPWNRKRFGVMVGGKKAKTEYKVIDYYKKINQTYSLLELYPKTGRTHQIRVHLKHINHPIVSDSFYAGKKTLVADKTWCPRLFLHAKNISFKHPTKNKIVSFSAYLPADLKKALQTLSLFA